ncbi:MAG: PQQ-binding-like beta-propeller repeat protein, partial [Planctomycetales bacterium]|nr:PQQ-binding-like beta-propeller repeat protein [Planctomycetales bacterium]
LFENLVIVNGDHDGDAYVVALDAATGSTVWKTPRENKTRSYSTPLIRQIDGRAQMLLAGNMCVASYDPRDGHQYWTFDGPTEQFVATVLYHQGLVLVTCGFPERHIVAIRPDGQGNVTDSHLVWHEQKGAAYVPSPVVTGDYLVVVNDAGIANCFVAATGERLWTERIGPRYEASLITAGGLVYITSYEGETTVVRPGPAYEEVTRNQLDEYCSASPAVSDGRIYLRTEQHLWAIGSK